MLWLSAKVPETDIFFRDKKKIENVLDWPAIVKKYYAVVKNAPKTWIYYNFAFFRGFSRLLFVLRDFVNRGAWCWLRKVIKDFGYNQHGSNHIYSWRGSLLIRLHCSDPHSTFWTVYVTPNSRVINLQKVLQMFSMFM